MQFLYKLSSLRSPLLLKFTLTTDFWHNLFWQQNNITNSRLDNWLGAGSDPMHCVHLLAVSQTILCGKKVWERRKAGLNGDPKTKLPKLKSDCYLGAHARYFAHALWGVNV